MPKTTGPHPGQTRDNDPEDEPDSMPIEPDQGPVPALIPEDPEQQRVVVMPD